MIHLGFVVDWHWEKVFRRVPLVFLVIIITPALHKHLRRFYPSVTDVIG